jgi:hypothetical protein
MDTSEKRKMGKTERCTTGLSAGRNCGEPGRGNYSSTRGKDL